MFRNVLTVLAVVLGITVTAFATQVTVTVQSFSFTPANTTILPTDTVRWTHANLAGLHNVHHNATPSLFGNAPNGAAWTYSVRFDTIAADTVPPIGTYPYVCEVHPTLMIGNVFVRSLWVTAPASAASWPVGSSQTIMWTSGSLTGNVNIELSRNYPNGGWETLFANTPDDGSEAWTVAGAATSNARIRVTSVSFPSVADLSCCDFSITPPPPSITVSMPNGGQTWYLGEAQTISWTSANVTGDLIVELDRDFANGGTWEDLFGPSLDDGSEVWFVNAPISSSARIRVRSIDLPAAADTSDADFVITELAAPQQLTILPSGTDLILRWQPVTGADGYNLYKSAVSSDSVFTALVGSTFGTTLTDVGGTIGLIRQFYRVRAYRGSAEPRDSTSPR